MSDESGGRRGLTITRRAVADLHADPANVNRHPAENLRAIADSLATFGQVEPLVVQAGTGRVIGGNGRLEVLRAKGEAWVDVVELDIDDTRAAALGIALNRTAGLAEMDEAALAAMLQALPSELRLGAGYTEADLAAVLAGMPRDLPPSPKLADRFGVPPFSVLDARQGYWQDRKRQWLGLGIQSELGRGGSYAER